MLNNLVVGEVKPSTTLGTIIVVTGAFLILMLLLKKFAWGAVTDMLKKREDKIANDLDSAEQSRIAAAKMEQERQQQLLSSKSDAAEIIKNAKESGEQTRQKLLNEANGEISHLKEKARGDISQEHDEAMASIKTDVSKLSIEIAEKILNKELSEASHEALINSYIESLGKSNEAR
ncbi:F0F1 ATP synthase subunit B [Melissococcus plutonius]|uniref:ATP synthase subunit b n=2 Tax=Melissococcus plutonius TaxID=33970 RepID=F3YBW9_MELPT|nr:F0F1 ATP synthase subunit B [Melissococcus plutonius]BAL61749.1 ATP synthase subunit B [Melissococcus plutonius DAT561]AIM25266.1 ATP synthase subunit b [Melissococcus plutonius S1]KMT23948.1 ATP synthase subunit b [Melissococcus plutonius]KMT24471.1 ATP synthase subunit b [Melissococcus plutonius]KMT26044.1 ATP synthase subunit b [Melissococcus plutonius]